MKKKSKYLQRVFLLIILIRSVTKFCIIFFIHSKNVIFVFSSSGFRKCYSFYFRGVKIDPDLSPMFKFTSEWYWFYYFLRMNLFQLTICCIDTFFIWIWRVVPFYAKIAVAPGSAIFFRQRSKVFCSWAPATTSWFKTLTGSTRLW